MGCREIHVMFRELHMMKKLMVPLERLALELYLDVVLEKKSSVGSWKFIRR